MLCFYYNTIDSYVYTPMILKSFFAFYRIEVKKEKNNSVESEHHGN